MTYGCNRPGCSPRGSLFLNLRFIRHGKINPGNFRMYGKVCTLEGGGMSSSHEDVKERGVLSQFPGQLGSNEWAASKISG